MDTPTWTDGDIVTVDQPFASTTVQYDRREGEWDRTAGGVTTTSELRDEDINELLDLANSPYVVRRRQVA